MLAVSFGGLGNSRFGLLLVRIRLLEVMLGFGVVSLGGALLHCLPLLPLGSGVLSAGLGFENHSPTGMEGVVYGYWEAEEDPEKLVLTDKLLQAVLAEAQVVCVGQPLLIVGDLNADPGVIPCLA